MEKIDDLRWHKSSYSGNGGNCVEVATTPGRTYIRDTKSRERGMLAVDAPAWRTFIADAKNGSLDIGLGTDDRGSRY